MEMNTLKGVRSYLAGSKASERNKSLNIKYQKEGRSHTMHEHRAETSRGKVVRVPRFMKERPTRTEIRQSEKIKC